MQGKRS